MQSDYTRKAQELAELKKQQSTQDDDISPDEKQLYNWNKEKGFVTQEDLNKFQEQQRQEQEFAKILDKMPELENHRKAIEDLQKAH